MIEQQKNKNDKNTRQIKKNKDENSKKTKLLGKMKDILVKFRGRLVGTIKEKTNTISHLPDNISYIESQNKKFVSKAFKYEKILTQKFKDISKLEKKHAYLRKEYDEKKNNNIDLSDKIQVQKIKIQMQVDEITKLSNKIKNYERIVENLEHELNNKDLKLQRKTKKYRREIARAKKCSNCSQRSIRKIKGSSSKILLNDLNQIKEESLSNYSDTDSDHQEVDLNDYQEVLDSRNKIRGMYNQIKAKYMDCINQKQWYKVRYQVLSNKVRKGN